jgi:hypothetical protein
MGGRATERDPAEACRALGRFGQQKAVAADPQSALSDEEMDLLADLVEASELESTTGAE